MCFDQENGGYCRHPERVMIPVQTCKIASTKCEPASKTIKAAIVKEGGEKQLKRHHGHLGSGHAQNQ